METKPLRYFITGCTGVVGSYIAKEIVRRGGVVRALRRSSSQFNQVGELADKIEWVEGDVLQPLSLLSYLEDIDYVIHAAAIVSFDPKEHKEMYKVNVKGTANVVNAALNKGIKKFCFISSIAAIGKPKGETLLKESSKWENDNEFPKYTVSKYLAEQEVWRGVAEGLEAVIVNPSVVLGIGDWKRSSLQIFDYLAKEPLFYPDGIFNYVDVRDVADISLKLLHSDISSERFILNAGNMPYQQAFKVMAQYLGKKPPTMLLKPWIAGLAWRAEWVLSLLLNRKAKVTKEALKSSNQHFQYDNSKVVNILKYNFRTLENTLEWVCENQ